MYSILFDDLHNIGMTRFSRKITSSEASCLGGGESWFCHLQVKCIYISHLDSLRFFKLVSDHGLAHAKVK